MTSVRLRLVVRAGDRRSAPSRSLEERRQELADTARSAAEYAAGLAALEAAEASLKEAL